MPYLPSSYGSTDAPVAVARPLPDKGGRRPVVLIAVLLAIIVVAGAYGAYSKFIHKAPAEPAADQTEKSESLKGLERAKAPLVGLRAAVDVCYQNCSDYHMDSTQSPLTYMQFVRDTGANEGLPKRLVDHEYDEALDAYAGSKFQPDPSFDYRVTVGGNVQAIPNDFSRRWMQPTSAKWVELTPDYKWIAHMEPPSPGKAIQHYQEAAPPPPPVKVAAKPSGRKKAPSTGKRSKTIRRR